MQWMVGLTLVSDFNSNTHTVSSYTAQVQHKHSSTSATKGLAFLESLQNWNRNHTIE
jgi:hypothetical protein